MTIGEIRNLPRTAGSTGCTSQLGLWIQANDDGDTEMADLVMSVMGDQTNCGSRDDRGIPMCDGTPGHSTMLLRRIDLREKG